MRRGIDEETYQRYLNAWVYLSTAFELSTDIGSFQRSSSPGKFWKETGERYCPKTAGNQIELRRKFTNFPVPKNADPIPKLFELEELAQLMRNAGIEVDAQSLAHSLRPFPTSVTTSNFES